MNKPRKEIKSMKILRIPPGPLAAIVFLLIAVNSHTYSQALLNQQRVYVMANRADGNTILVYHRTAEGGLSQVAEVSTGGLGSGPGELPAPFPLGIPAGNPLTTQDNLVLTENGRFLLTVNAGSNDISVLAVTNDGLELVEKAPSGGDVPVSIAQHGNLVYVINEGELSADELGKVPSMTGYFIDQNGHLTPIPNSFRITGRPDAQPGDILFSPDGRWLIITDKFAETFIHILHVDDDRTTHEARDYVSNIPAPLGAAFTHHNILAVTEANAKFIDGKRAGVPNGSSMSSYILNDHGELTPVSLSVRTEQTVASYVRFTPDGRFAFVTAKGSGSISSFTVSPHGELALLQSIAALTEGAFSEPIDEDITPDGQFLYVVAPMAALGNTLVLPIPLNAGALLGFRIGQDGSLTPVSVVEGLPISTVGVVAR
jgi:6-phosphogluconolactonase